LTYTVELCPLDYRVTGGEDLPDLPGYAGRAGMYVTLNPVRTLLVAAFVAAAAAVAGELIVPMSTLVGGLLGAH
jgi:hypothetical protein